MQPLPDPPTGRELAQFLDPDGAAYSFRLEQSGDETTAHPTGKIGRGAVWFLNLIYALVVAGAGVAAFQWWQANEILLAVATAIGTAVTARGGLWIVERIFRAHDQFFLVHGPFARWSPTAGTIHLPRLGVTLRREQLVGAVCLVGGEWCGGWIRAGAWCPLASGLPGAARRPDNGWMQVNELSVIAMATDGTLVRYPLVTAQYPWLFREFAAGFAAEFGIPLQVIFLNRVTLRELRREGWKHAGEFADADRPRKVAAGRVAVCDGHFPGFGTVALCHATAAAPQDTGREPSASSRT